MSYDIEMFSSCTLHINVVYNQNALYNINNLLDLTQPWLGAVNETETVAKCIQDGTSGSKIGLVGPRLVSGRQTWPTIP